MADIRNDIEKYLKGELSPAEMHALEKRALSDPFLAEALEGASSIEAHDFKHDLKELEVSLATKTKIKGSGSSHFLNWPLRIAAGVLILAASAYLINSLFKNIPSKSQLALNKSPEEISSDALSQSADSIRQEEELLLDADRNVAMQPERKSETKPGTLPAAESREEGAMEREEEAPPLPQQTDKVVALEESTADDTPQERVASQTSEPVKEDVAVLNKDVPQLAKAKKEASRVAGASPAARDAVSSGFINLVTIKGQVTDVDDGLPIPGVNVLVKGTSIGSVTDLNGNYQIALPDESNDLLFSFIGLESKEVSITASDKATKEIDVQMAQDVSQLSEVVVVGYGTEEEYEGIRWELAEPEGGKKEFKNYLEKNLLYPEVAIENQVEGKVSIAFTIQPNGNLTDFRVIRSLGHGCDEEVIRLIKEGPKWRPTKRNDEPVMGKGKVKMRFTLPNKKK